MRQLTLEAELHRALDRDEFALVYQPFFDLVDGRMVAVESLLRWHHPTDGIRGPDQFLDVAEQADLIVSIGSWVIESACRQASLWHRDYGQAAPRIWINISSRQLTEDRLRGVIARLLSEHHLSGECLGLELTERQIIDRPKVVGRQLESLVESGIGLAIDDFGTGHNGFGYLRDLPADTIKIDRSFVAGLGTDRTDAAITSSIINLAQSLDLDVVAEGIENEEQKQSLRDLGCGLGQGFHLARPADPAEIEARYLAPAGSSGGRD